MILDCVGGNTRTVKTIVLMEPFDEELVARGKECGIEILSLKEIEVRLHVFMDRCASTLWLLSGGSGSVVEYLSLFKGCISQTAILSHACLTSGSRAGLQLLQLKPQRVRHTSFHKSQTG